MAGLLPILKNKCHSEAANYKTLQPLLQMNEQQKQQEAIVKCPTTTVSKRVRELMFLSYLEGSLHAERSPEDLRSWARSKQPIQRQLRAVAKRWLNREKCHGGRAPPSVASL